MASDDYRDYILPPDTFRIQAARGVDPKTYTERMLSNEKGAKLRDEWQAALDEPFQGVTPDGEVEHGLFDLEDEGFDVAPAVAAAEAFLETLDEAQRKQVGYPVDAPEWRGWYNPEIQFNDNGVRLENMSEGSRQAFLKLLQAFTSEKGFTKIRRLMDANHFLGELYDLNNIMNRWSYHVLMFGEPSTTKPWGWSLYGHHAAICCFVVGRQLVISPTFMGVEPKHIDRGDGEAFTLLTGEESLGLALMQSLSPTLRERATIYRLMEDPAMPDWRFNFADQRHLGGACQDNRVIPLEGIRASELDRSQRAKLMQVIETFLEFLPDGPRAARMRLVESHLDDTWWNWIGGCGDDDVFYYRIQSPVIMIEFDHHSGMWLGNEEPAKFHIHTITRIPNGNDYGKALLDQFQKHCGCGVHGPDREPGQAG
ncbi:DUF3500 domain-containing protein [Marinobacter sp. JSM 1782161]|uniref:DUF3500 domain-containing protein n=1 Tax=Marinobacter sp. JSM 1782161 TaxID=2685906 RepID=UPI001402A743|nr:DUF3500 domain-containing protein [Marinobacter sp. JSM 1782161]